MTAQSKPAEASDVDRMQSAITKMKRLRTVPQGYDELGELVAVRTLLKFDRPEEALERLDILMDRYFSGWRTLA